MNFKVPNAIVWSAPLGVILGGLVGYLWPDIGGLAAFLYVGELFLGALRLLVIPLVVVSVITGLAALRNTQRAGKALTLTLGYFVGTTLIATLLGILVVSIMSPGLALTGFEGAVDSQVTSMQSATSTNVLGVALQSLFPSDWGTAARGQYLGIILLSMIFGVVLATMGSRQRAVADTFRGINEALLRLFRLVIWAAPIGLFFVAASAVASGADSLSGFANVGYFLIALAVGLVLHVCVILPLILHYLGGKNVVEYYHNLLPAMGTALASGSSAAALPVTYSCVVDRNSISHRAASVTLPMGSCLNFDGAAMFSAMAVIFAAQAAGFSLSIGNYLFILAASLGMSFITAGVPVMAMLTAVLVATAIGLPDRGLAVLGLVLPLQWLTVRGGALMSIMSDSIGAAVIAKQLGERTDARRVRDERTTSRGRDDRRGAPRDSRDRRGGRDYRDRNDSRDNRDSRGRRDASGRDDRRGGRGRIENTGRPDRGRPSGRDEGRGRPTGRDDSRGRPAGRDDSTTRPTGRDDSRTRPAGRDDNRTRPTGRDDSRPRPNGRDESRTRPTGRDDSRERGTQDRGERGGRRPQDRSSQSPFAIRAESSSRQPDLESPAAPHTPMSADTEPFLKPEPVSKAESTSKPETQESGSGQINYGRKRSSRGRGGKPDRQEGQKADARTKGSDQEPNQRSPRGGSNRRSDQKPTPPESSKPITEEQELDDMASRTVQRERAKVAAQLAAMRQAEELSRAALKAADKVTEKIDRRAQEAAEEKAEIEELSAGAVQIDYVIDDKPEVKSAENETPEPVAKVTEPKPKVVEERQVKAEAEATGRTEEEPQAKADPDESNESDEDPDVQYGRKRRIRGGRKGGSSSDNDDNENNVAVMDDPKPLDDFSSENMSFGRSRKKRTR